MDIKGPKGPGGPTPTPEITPAKSSKAEGASFKNVLEAKAEQAEGAISPRGVEQIIATLSEQVQAGKTSPSEARQQLVAEVAKAMGPMPDEVRGRLETFLSAQLQSDPNLAAHAAKLFEPEGT